MHSNISADGVYPVEELLSIAENVGLKTISITDHNSALAHFLIKNINVDKYFSGEIVSGIEIDVTHNGVTFDLLAYNFDVVPVMEWAYKKFGTVTDRQSKIRQKLYELLDKNEILYEKDFPWNPKQEFAHINVFNNFSRFPENLDKLGTKIADGSDFYRNSTTNNDFLLYLNMDFLWATISEVKSVIHSNGGKIFLAHPYGYKANVDVDRLLDIVLKEGLDGIEVYHTKHSAEQIKYLDTFCKKHNLLISGGSDFHGKNGEKMVDWDIQKFW